MICNYIIFNYTADYSSNSVGYSEERSPELEIYFKKEFNSLEHSECIIEVIKTVCSASILKHVILV